MSELEHTITALVIAAAFIGFFSLCFLGALMFAEYTRGRKRGGYPIFAKTRKKLFKHDITESAYIVGLKQAQKKLEKGGYK